MFRARSPWLPCSGAVAPCVGGNSRNRRNVRVMAAAFFRRTAVAAIGKHGAPLRSTGRRANPKPMESGSFDPEILGHGLVEMT